MFLVVSFVFSGCGVEGRGLRACPPGEVLSRRWSFWTILKLNRPLSLICFSDFTDLIDAVLMIFQSDR